MLTIKFEDHTITGDMMREIFRIELTSNALASVYDKWLFHPTLPNGRGMTLSILYSLSARGEYIILHDVQCSKVIFAGFSGDAINLLKLKPINS